MSGNRPFAWIRIWRSLKWPPHTCSHDDTQALTETETLPTPPPLAVPAEPAHKAVDRPEIVAEAAEALVMASPIHIPLLIQSDPTFDSEAVDPGLGAEQAKPKLPLIQPLLTFNAEPTCEADDSVEAPISMQSFRPTTDFALPARLAVVANLNVASIRAPRRRPYRLPPGKAVPLPARTQPAHVGRTPRLEGIKPTTRLIVQKPAAATPAFVIDLEAVRKVVQSSPAAKQAA